MCGTVWVLLSLCCPCADPCAGRTQTSGGGIMESTRARPRPKKLHVRFVPPAPVAMGFAVLQQGAQVLRVGDSIRPCRVRPPFCIKLVPAGWKVRGYQRAHVVSYLAESRQDPVIWVIYKCIYNVYKYCIIKHKFFIIDIIYL